jgi:hypothetical protein
VPEGPRAIRLAAFRLLAGDDRAFREGLAPTGKANLIDQVVGRRPDQAAKVQPRGQELADARGAGPAHRPARGGLRRLLG